MNKLLLCLIVAFSCFSLWAQTGQAPNNMENIDQVDLEQMEQSVLVEGNMITQSRDEITGIALKSYNTLEDNGRYSFLYHVNSDLYDFANVSGLEFSFAKRFDWAWLELSVVRTTAQTDNITDYNPLPNTIDEDLLMQSNAVLELGVGLSYRSHYVRDLIDSENLFETIAATLEYVNFSESYYGDTFNGFGLKTDFGLHIRSGRRMHYGLKLSHHLASVKRAASYSGEPSSNRALLLRWISLGLDLSFYY